MKVLFVLLFCSSVILSSGQSDIVINKSKDADLIRLLNSISLVKSDSSEDLSISIFKVANEPGSAGYPNGETTENLFVAISEHDEYPEQSLFEIGPFYNPKVISCLYKDHRFEFIVKYGPADRRKEVKFVVTIRELKEI